MGSSDKGTIGKKSSRRRRTVFIRLVLDMARPERYSRACKGANVSCSVQLWKHMSLQLVLLGAGGLCVVVVVTAGLVFV
jgi:hypothetical protein